MLFVRYKFRHIEHNTVHTLFQFITRTRLTLADDMAQCQIFLTQTAQCRICCLKFAFHTCTPGRFLPLVRFGTSFEANFETCQEAAGAGCCSTHRVISYLSNSGAERPVEVSSCLIIHQIILKIHYIFLVHLL